MGFRSDESDRFAASRLPDLPNAGFSTKREKALSDAMMMFVRGAERDRLWLLSMVCDGPDKFKVVMRKAWRAWKVDDEDIEGTWRYLVLLAGAEPELQRDALLRMPRQAVGTF